MRKILLVLAIAMLSISSVCFAEDVAREQVEEVTATTIAASKAEITALPWAFRFNKFLLNVRKAITTDPVEKLNIDGEILAREAKIISEYQASGKINQENSLVQNHLRMKENLANRISRLEEKDERINALIERVVESPVISEERQDRLVEIFTERQERLGIRSEFLEEKTKIIEERKNTLDQTKEQRKEIVEQIRELPKNPDATREEVQAQRKELIEDLKDVKDASLEKLNQLREQGKEILEKKKEEIQNMQKPAAPIRNMQKAMEGVSNEVAQ